MGVSVGDSGLSAAGRTMLPLAFLRTQKPFQMAEWSERQRIARVFARPAGPGLRAITAEVKVQVGLQQEPRYHAALRGRSYKVNAWFPHALRATKKVSVPDPHSPFPEKA